MTDMSKEAVKFFEPDCYAGSAFMEEDPQGCWVGIEDYDALLAELDEAKAEIERRHNAQSYTYIGKDGKSVQARDLEDERDALKAEVERLRSFVGEFATAVFPATRNFTGPHPADEIEATTPADYVHAFQEDALTLLKGSSQ